MAGFCTTCGHARNADERFCQQCGAEIVTAAATPEEVGVTGRLEENPAPEPNPDRGHRGVLAGVVAAGAILAVVAVWLVSQQGGSEPSASGVAGTQPAAAPTSSTAPASASASASPTEDAAAVLADKQKRQARRLVTIISRSANSRAKVIRGVSLVQGCQDPDGGATLLRDAIAGRSNVLTQLADVTVSALPSGKRMVAELEDAQRNSLRADQAYLGWARTVSSDCYYYGEAYEDEQYSAGVRASGDAQVAKKKFLRHWDDVAELTGVRRFTSSDI